MASAKKLDIKESITELRQVQRKQIPLIANRISVLIAIKQLEKHGGVTKRELALQTGFSHCSITKWRRLYESGGLSSILGHKKTGFKPRVLSSTEHLAIENKLKDPNNNIQGYKELADWLKKEYNKEIKYTTLNEYCKKHFGTKIKTARKSHILKDDQAVNAFKKTLVLGS